MSRLFGIALSLVNAKDELLPIGEFENGMCYSVQLDTWCRIFGLAAASGVQIFAASHSLDVIEAFQKAAAEILEEDALVRLAHEGEDIIPAVFREDELEIATRKPHRGALEGSCSSRAKMTNMCPSTCAVTEM